MTQFVYLFERFPSFGQTFCYREVAELARQGIAPPIFSIRNPKDEPPQEWDQRIVKRVHYLPEERELLNDVRRTSKKGKLTAESIAAIDEWGRRTDFLRLYQAVYIGLRLQEMGIPHVHAHFAGMAARTAFWIHKFFPITFSFTAHANDIFTPRDFEIGLDKLVGAARVIVTETDYAARFLRERFPDRADRVHRVYNGLNLAEFTRPDFSSAPSLVVAVGRLIAKKGFADLIDDSGLQDRVELSGAKPQREVRQRLAAASVFILPSVIDPEGGMDNLPTVIMEAMATGLPVISTTTGGIPEMVVQRETGFLVSPGDATALADAIEKLISDAVLAQKMGRAGYERAQNLFSIERNVRELCTLINAGTGD